MKRILLTGFLTVILSAFSFAQLTWYTQNSGTTTQLTAISFVDQNNGWISGEIGTMLHTTDGGQTWNYQTVPTPYGLYSVFFTDAQNGWTTGEGGNIFHTTDGGQNWVSQLTYPVLSTICCMKNITSLACSPSVLGIGKKHTIQSIRCRYSLIIPRLSSICCMKHRSYLP